MTKPCTLCTPTWICPWCAPEAIAETDRLWEGHDPSQAGFDITEFYGGLEVTQARHDSNQRMIDYIRARNQRAREDREEIAA